jgi:hypothetical protein
MSGLGAADLARRAVRMEMDLGALVKSVQDRPHSAKDRDCDVGLA